MILVAVKSGIVAVLLPAVDVFSAHESHCTVPALAMQYGHTVHDINPSFWLSLSSFMRLFFTRGMSKLYIILFLALYQCTCGWGPLKLYMFCYFVISQTQLMFCELCMHSVLFFSAGVWWSTRETLIWQWMVVFKMPYRQTHFHNFLIFRSHVIILWKNL